MERNEKLKKQYTNFKSRWRRSINQFSQLEEQTKLQQLDTLNRKISTMKLKMKNRLAQIDEDWYPVAKTINNIQNNATHSLTNPKCKITSTNHDTNIMTLASENKLEQSILISATQQNPQQNFFLTPPKPYTCHEIRQEIIQQLTEYNKQKYQQEMKQLCNQYNGSLKSVFYSLIKSNKSHLEQFCYLCDSVSKDNNKKDIASHQCIKPLDSILTVNNALQSLRQTIEKENNKIFNIFIHNSLQPSITVDELISNLTVLKQSNDLNYGPQQNILRLRLMNLMAKKITLLIEQKDLQQRLFSICKSKK